MFALKSSSIFLAIFSLAFSKPFFSLNLLPGFSFKPKDLFISKSFVWSASKKNSLTKDSFKVKLNSSPKNSALSFQLLNCFSSCDDSNIANPNSPSIALFNKDDYSEPVIIARLPKPVMKSKKVATIFKIKLDI